mgnify:FL=1
MTDLWPDAEVGEMVSDGVVLSFEAASAITKGKAVYLSADMKVSQCTATTQWAIGIAIKTVAVGEFCSVCMRGVVKVTADGAITRGGAVQTSADGDVIALEDAAAVGDVDDRISRTLGVGLQTFANGDSGLIYVDKA